MAKCRPASCKLQAKRGISRNQRRLLHTESCTTPWARHGQSGGQVCNVGKNLPAVVVVSPLVAQVDDKADECDEGLQDDVVQNALLALPEEVDAHVPLPAAQECNGAACCLGIKAA